VSDPKEQQQSDELDLDAQTVRDLELQEENAGDVRGGSEGACWRYSLYMGTCGCGKAD